MILVGEKVVKRGKEVWEEWRGWWSGRGAGDGGGEQVT